MSERRGRAGAGLLCAALVAGSVAFLAPTPATATVRPAATKTVTLSATFETSGQSLWGAGAAAAPATQGLDLFDKSWDRSASGGGVWSPEIFGESVGDYGADGTISSKGRIGLSLDLDGMSGGSVGVKYPVDVDFTMPADKSFGAGDTIEISTTEAAVQPGAKIETVEPDVSGVSLNGTFAFQAGAQLRACFVDCWTFGGDIVNIPQTTGEIFSVDQAQIQNPVKASPAGTYCFGPAENAIFGLGTLASGTRCEGNGGYVARPKVAVVSTTNADGTLSASGSDRFAVIPVDGVKWLQRLAGIPALSQNMSLGSGINLGWSALSLVFSTEVTRSEALTFAPKVDVTLAFPRSLSYRILTSGDVPVSSGTGTSATLRSGNKIRIDVPTDQTESFKLTPTLSLAVHNLSNHVSNTVSGSGFLSALSVHISTPSYEVAGVEWFSGEEFDIGPAYTRLFQLGSTTIDVMSPKTWALGGFNSPTLSPLTLVPAPPPVVTPVAITPVEGAPFTSTVATFTDEVTIAVPADYVATINWGDGTPLSPGTITGSGGSYSIAGTHTYEQYGPYPIVVDLRTVPAGQLATNHVVTDNSATVSDAVITGTGLTNNTTATGQPILTWPNPSPASPNNRVASFADANPFGLLSDLSATINWGDGTPATVGVVTGPTGGPFIVSGAHNYTALGLHTTTVSLTSLGGSRSTATTTTLSYSNLARGGTFVLGSKKATGSVTFWSSQWMKSNAISTTAASNFKGYANQTPPACGTTWSGNSASGLSSVPPSAVPTYQAVAVTSAVKTVGTVTTGNTVAVVVVRTNPGYDPKKIGTGTVITVLCGRVG